LGEGGEGGKSQEMRWIHAPLMQCSLHYGIPDATLG